jgi:hypothetical protein
MKYSNKESTLEVCSSKSEYYIGPYEIMYKKKGAMIESHSTGDGSD